jgi:hypothetical protein
MALRSSFIAAILLAGFALAPTSASAQSQAGCSYDQYGRTYNCRVPQHVGCGGCGNRGLFTSTWVQPTTPCGYSPCQYTVQPCGQCGGNVAPVNVENDDDDAPRYHHRYHRRYHAKHPY